MFDIAVYTPRASLSYYSSELLSKSLCGVGDKSSRM